MQFNLLKNKNIFVIIIPIILISIITLTIIFFSNTKYDNPAKLNKNEETKKTSPINMDALRLVKYNISDYTIHKGVPKNFVPVYVQKAKSKPKHQKKDKPSTKKDSKKLIDYTAKYPYEIRVNRSENFVVVYGIDKNGDYTIPYKAFICSTAKHVEDTPLGIFTISDKYRWHLMVDGTYAQYAMRISGEIMLHSVPYYSPNNNDLESKEYNKLGKPASLGCIRMRVSAIKWIYKNCKPGTTVNIYETTGEEPPITIPKLKKLNLEDECSGWDPTDPVKDNPWKKK